MSQPWKRWKSTIWSLKSSNNTAWSLNANRFELTMHDCDHQVIGDHCLLRQVLNNLVSNAIKFSPADTLTSIWTEPKAEMVRICVADGGPGIPEDERTQAVQHVQ